MLVFSKNYFTYICIHRVKITYRQKKSESVLLHAPSHPSEDILKSDSIKTIFIHANMTFISHRLDQGVIETVRKKHGKRKLLSYIWTWGNNVIKTKNYRLWNLCVDRMMKLFWWNNNKHIFYKNMANGTMEKMDPQNLCTRLNEKFVVLCNLHQDMKVFIKMKC